uniref:Uncharacterized protein n=1 Tax=Oryza meridionalis TaxID=40149 RepID=A0A0E0E1C4_9ORYZ
MEPRSSAAAVATLHCWPRWRIPQNYRRPHHSARSSQSPHRAPRPSHRAIAPPPPRCLLHRGRPWHRRRCPQNGVQMGWGKGGAFGDGKEGETAVAAGDNGEGGIANVQSCDMKDRFPPRAAATIYSHAMRNQVQSTAMPCGIRLPLLSWFGGKMEMVQMDLQSNQMPYHEKEEVAWPAEVATDVLAISGKFSYTLASAGMVLLLAFTTYQLGFPFGLKTVKMTSIILSKRILYVHDN